MNKPLFSILLLILLVFVGMACSKTNKKVTLDSILLSKEKADELVTIIEGNWKGNYQILSPTYDTSFYASQDEKLAFLLANEIVDSSLVKGITIKDTFEIASIKINFNFDKAVSTITVSVPDTIISIDFTVFYYHEARLQFGYDALQTVQEKDQVVVDYTLAHHLSLQQALLSTHFELLILSYSKDSLTLGLDNGYGKIRLKKEK